MHCNATFFPPPFPSRRESVSWLYDVIHMGDIDFGYNDTTEDWKDEENSAENVSTDQFRRSSFKVAAVILLVIVALVGNCLVILSVFCNKAMRTTMNYYLVNLSIADLMITAWCPIHSLVKELSDKNQYVLPAVFCKIGVFYTVLCMVSSILTLSAISFDRFLAVIFPLRTRVTQRKARYFIVSVWIVAAMVASPFLFYRKIVELRQNIGGYSWSSQSCMDVFPTTLECDQRTHKMFQDQTAKKIYYSLVNIVMFFIPIVLMTICYSMIVAKLYCTVSPGERVGGVPPQARAKRKVVKLVLVVIATFVICWSPHQVPMAHAIFFTGSQLPSWLIQNEFWINMFAYSHAMINPLIYITFNDNFKKSFKRMICCSEEEITFEYSNPSSFHQQFSWKRTFSRKKSQNEVNFHDIEIRCVNPDRFSCQTSNSSQTSTIISKTSFAESMPKYQRSGHARMSLRKK